MGFMLGGIQRFAQKLQGFPVYANADTLQEIPSGDSIGPWVTYAGSGMVAQDEHSPIRGILSGVIFGTILWLVLLTAAVAFF